MRRKRQIKQNKQEHLFFPLSSGQAQKVLIARACVGQPKILILDDSLDLLDPDSIQGISEFLKVRDRSGAVVLTTRSPDLAKRFDQIVVLSPAHPDGPENQSAGQMSLGFPGRGAAHE